MKNSTALAIAAALGAAMAGSFAPAQDMQAVTVQASRTVPAKVTEHITAGVPIVDISIAYGVKTSDIDLATHSGATVLEQRVRDAAKAACKEIGRQYPEATPNEQDCASAAVAKAMVQVKSMVAAAEQAHK